MNSLQDWEYLIEPSITIEELSMIDSQYGKIVFHNVLDSYSTDSDLVVHYSVISGVTIHADDRICLLPVGWTDLSEQVASVKISDHKQIENAKAVFSSKVLPKSSGEKLYQFCYICNSGDICGASIPFQFLLNDGSDLCLAEERGDLVVVQSKSSLVAEKYTEVFNQIEKLHKENKELRTNLEVVTSQLNLIKENLEPKEAGKTVSNEVHSFTVENEDFQEQASNKSKESQNREDIGSNETKNLLGDPKNDFWKILDSILKLNIASDASSSKFSSSYLEEFVGKESMPELICLLQNNYKQLSIDMKNLQQRQILLETKLKAAEKEQDTFNFVLKQEGENANCLVNKELVNISKENNLQVDEQERLECALPQETPILACINDTLSNVEGEQQNSSTENTLKYFIGESSEIGAPASKDFLTYCIPSEMPGEPPELFNLKEKCLQFLENYRSQYKLLEGVKKELKCLSDSLIAVNSRQSDVTAQFNSILEIYNKTLEEMDKLRRLTVQTSRICHSDDLSLGMDLFGNAGFPISEDDMDTLCFSASSLKQQKAAISGELQALNYQEKEIREAIETKKLEKEDYKRNLGELIEDFEKTVTSMNDAATNKDAPLQIMNESVSVEDLLNRLTLSSQEYKKLYAEKEALRKAFKRVLKGTVPDWTKLKQKSSSSTEMASSICLLDPSDSDSNKKIQP